MADGEGDLLLRRHDKSSNSFFFWRGLTTVHLSNAASVFDKTGCTESPPKFFYSRSEPALGSLQQL